MVLTIGNCIKYSNINQVAKILGVVPPTLRRWDRDGKLKAIRIGNKRGVGERRYRREDIIQFITRS